MRYIYCLEGNIGAGKSTLLQAITQRLSRDNLTDKFSILCEPLDTWRNVAGEDLLQNFYQNPTKWSYLLNTHIFNTLIERRLYIINELTTHCLLERSGSATEHVFVPYAHANGLMTTTEFYVFNNTSRLLNSNHSTSHHPNITTIFLYLRTPPSVCLERIQQRDGNVETQSSNCSLEWLTELHNLHELWLTPLSPIILDGTLPLITLEQQIMNIFSTCLH